MLLIMAVLGSIYAGIATATERQPSACWIASGGRASAR